MELNQVTLPVTDVPRAVAFYTRLGFRQIVDAADYARFECRPYGPTFSVMLTPAAQGANTGVVVYFESDDLDAACAALRADGVQFETEPRDEPWLWREAHLRDPDGNRICLYHAGNNRLNPPWRLETGGRSFELDGIDHVALAVRDVSRSVEWYQRVLGLRRMHEDAWGDYPAVVGVGRTALALFPVDGDAPTRRPGRDVLTMRHLAFRVDAVNFAMARAGLVEQGIALTFQDHGIAHSIYFNDPDGYEIEITTYDLRHPRAG